jgi:hypothetical protein
VIAVQRRKQVPRIWTMSFDGVGKLPRNCGPALRIQIGCQVVRYATQETDLASCGTQTRVHRFDVWNARVVWVNKADVFHPRPHHE